MTTSQWSSGRAYSKVKPCAISMCSTCTFTHTQTLPLITKPIFLLSRQTSEGVWQAKLVSRVTDSRTSVNQVNKTMKPFEIWESCIVLSKTKIYDLLLSRAFLKLKHSSCEKQILLRSKNHTFTIIHDIIKP